MAEVTTGRETVHAAKFPDVAVSDLEIHRSCSEQLDMHQSTGRLVIVAGKLHREAQPSQFDPTLAPHPPVSYQFSNPEWWQQEYRRVPSYRPVNTRLDREQRRQAMLFRAVGTFMILGCSIIANWSSLWRNTAGRVTSIGIGSVGGEF